MADPKSNPVLNPTGLTDEECQEVHDYFQRGLLFWVGVAAVAHLLVWQWLPWFPG